MTGLSIQFVQYLSTRRANRWHDGDMHEWSTLEWAGAMCGEAGEAANVAKKIKRIESGRRGNEASEHAVAPDDLRAKLARECADVFLYLVLLAESQEIDLQAAVIETFNAKSRELGFPELLPEIAAVDAPLTPYLYGERANG